MSPISELAAKLKKMKPTLALINLILLFDCHSDNYDYNQDDFQVYSTILSKYSNSLVITDLFIQDRYQLKEFLNKKIITSAEKKSMNQQLRYLIRHEIKYRIDPAKLQNKTISEIEIDSIFKKNNKYGPDGGFEELIRLYNTRSLIRFSLPLFAENRTRAIFISVFSCGSLCGEEKIYLCEKKENLWNLKDSVQSVVF